MYYHHLFIERFEQNCSYRHSCRLPDSASRRVVFRLRMSPRIRSQNRNGLKRSVMDLCQTGLRKNPRKSASLRCPFKITVVRRYWESKKNVKLCYIKTNLPGMIKPACEQLGGRTSAIPPVRPAWDSFQGGVNDRSSRYLLAVSCCILSKRSSSKGPKVSWMDECRSILFFLRIFLSSPK
jgi:hypothetical protein